MNAPWTKYKRWGKSWKKISTDKLWQLPVLESHEVQSDFGALWQPGVPHFNPHGGQKVEGHCLQTLALKRSFQGHTRYTTPRSLPCNREHVAWHLMLPAWEVRIQDRVGPRSGRQARLLFLLFHTASLQTKLTESQVGGRGKRATAHAFLLLPDGGFSPSCISSGEQLIDEWRMMVRSICGQGLTQVDYKMVCELREEKSHETAKFSSRNLGKNNFHWMAMKGWGRQKENLRLIAYHRMCSIYV